MSRSNLILYWSKTKVFLPFFVSLTCFTYHYKCRGFLLRLISLKDTHTHSVELLWTRDRPVGETYI